MYEQITKWPILKEAVLEIFIAFVGNLSKNVILDIPLLIEQKFIRYFCDVVIVVYCSSDVQLHRLMIRDDISEKEAHLKIDKQMNIELKKKYAHVVIDNDGVLAVTHVQLKEWKNNLKDKPFGEISWKHACKPTKLSLLIATVLCIAGYLMHRLIMLF